MSNVSRRGFVKGAGLSALAMGVAGSVAVADEATVAWAKECDVLVVGLGGAGIAAGITAAQENLGDVLVIEAAPKGEEGGNSRCCGQLVMSPNSVESAVEYQTNLNGDYIVAPELLEAWATELCKNVEWLNGIGCDMHASMICSPEYPDVPGATSPLTWTNGPHMGNETLWVALDAAATELGVNIEYGTRAVRLVIENGEIHGVICETADGEIAIKAKKGVVLSCGGFENNPEMMNTYFSIGMTAKQVIPVGTPYNRGDGIKMAQQAGAQLWHMNAFSIGGIASPVMDEADGIWQPCGSFPYFGSKDYIYVGPTGQRFMYEESISLTRHGKVEVGGSGVYMDQQIAGPAWAVMGSECYNSDTIFSFLPYLSIWSMKKRAVETTNEEDVANGVILKGETIEELAEQMGIEPSALAATVAFYNENAANGVDPLFHRGEAFYSSNQDMTGRGNVAAEQAGEKADASINPFDLKQLEGPFYAVPLCFGLLNTQGGPKRGVNGEVLDVFEQPIPRLYAAGEMGTVYAYGYNGGGNFGEALSSGRIAVRSAAKLEPWA